MDLTEAIEIHAEWKAKFRIAVSKHRTMDADRISMDNCCELGRWLYGESKVKFGKLTSYSECVRKHAVFHKEAGKVARAINDKRYAEVLDMIAPGTPYATASRSVEVAIKKLKKEAGL